MTKQFKITGMKCDHCRMSVENAIKGVKGVTAASVDLKAAKAQVEGNFSDDDVVAAVEEAGFGVE